MSTRRERKRGGVVPTPYIEEPEAEEQPSEPEASETEPEGCHWPDCACDEYGGRCGAARALTTPTSETRTG
jgi:hypothetical protein